MSYTSFRRHSRWYERVWFSEIFQLLVGGVFVVLLPAWWEWGFGELSWSTLTDAQLNTLTVTLFAFVIAFVSTRRIQQYPGAQTLGYLLTTPVLVWGCGLLLLSFLRGDYSRQVLLASLVLNILWVVSSYFAGRRFRIPKFGVVPFGRVSQILKQKNARVYKLAEPQLNGQRYDAVVADFRADDMPADWERFLARCTLAGVPVFHYKQLVESLTGRVQIDHLSENIFGTLQPSGLYLGFKRVVDFIMVFLLLPFLIPLLLITAIVIKLDSEGSVFYTQQRMGYRGRSFKMYKFRSMYSDMEGRGFTEGSEDPRITRVGAVIRKYRIDELPQVLNVLKGDMSFIGPRPESMELSNWYEKDVPFFSYRHVVRPGLSGWAQVEQGYAAEVDGMTRKLQYDFYYIKNFSIWLDILIVLKTIRTVLTGFGAR